MWKWIFLNIVSLLYSASFLVVDVLTSKEHFFLKQINSESLFWIEDIQVAKTSLISVNCFAVRYMSSKFFGWNKIAFLSILLFILILV